MTVFVHRVRLCPPSLHASQQYITSWSLCGQPIGDHLIIIFGSVPNVHDDLISLHDCGPFALLSLEAKPPLTPRAHRLQLNELQSHLCS